MPRARVRSVTSGVRRTAALIAVGCISVACGSDPPDEPSLPILDDPTTSTLTTTTSTTSTTSTTTTTMAPGVEEIADLLASSSPEEKARQLVATGVRGDRLAEALVAEVGSPCVGGVFVTETNNNWRPVDDADAAPAASIATLSRAAQSAPCVGPPLVMTDAEPGSVLRVPIAPLDSAPVLAERVADGDADALEAVATESAAFVASLAALGVNVNLGVVADLDADPSYYMARRQRTFGADPALTTTLAATLVDIHCFAGVAPTLKHFPNQGATPEDPHSTRSVAVGGEAGWFALGRAPYVDTRAPLVMTGHIFMDTDPDRPATLSRSITTGLLRDDLAYDGVIVTDDLFAMRGISDVVPDVAERAVEAIAAGADLALFVVEDDVGATIAAIVERAADDADFAARVDESVERVLVLKAGLGLVDAIDPAWFPLCD